jgi:glutamate synthase (NADPH) small chain
MQKPDKKQRPKLPRIDPPTRSAEERKRDFCEVYLGYDPDSAIREAQRCVECKDPPCEEVCPLHNRIKDWLVLAADGKLLQAAAFSRLTSNMPEICGRICPQDRLCESDCIIGVKNRPVAIGAVERFINEYAFERLGRIPGPRRAWRMGIRVAVVGAGPAGLACAEELIKRGYGVTVFEAMPHPGGLLVYGIPGFKLEKWVVERRVKYLEGLGVEFRCNTKVGSELSLDELFGQGYHAVFIGIGAQKTKNPKIPGMDCRGVHVALPFLIRNNLDPDLLPDGQWSKDDLGGKLVTVFGGGDTAMDCLRTSVRIGAARVVCVYRRDEENMPGSRQEVKRAKEEGVEFFFYTAPVRFIGDETGCLKKVECIRMELGEPDSSGRRSPIPVDGSNFEIETDFAILAFGFDGNPLDDAGGKLKVRKDGCYETDEQKMTSWPGVFAGGDTVRGPDLLVTALKDGRDAAAAIDRYLCERSEEKSSQQEGSLQHYA